MNTDYDPSIEYRTKAKQEASRIIQKRAGDVNCGIHDEKFKELFDLAIHPLLPGEMLNCLAAHRTLYYARKYLTKAGYDPKQVTIEQVIPNFKCGIEIKNGETPEILMRTFSDYTKYPTIWVDNKIMLASDYAEKAASSEKEPVQDEQIDKILLYHSKVRLSAKLDRIKFEPEEDSNSLLRWGQIEADWQGDEEYYNTLAELCGYQIDRQAHVLLYLVANFAKIFIDLLSHPNKAGPYKKDFEDIGKKVDIVPVEAQELASLVDNFKDREDFLRLASLYQLEDKIWLPTRRLPSYYEYQEIKAFSGIEQVYNGQPCDIFICDIKNVRGYSKFTLVGAVQKEGDHMWKVFESKVNLRYLALRNMGFDKLIKRVEAKRKETKATEKKASEDAT